MNREVTFALAMSAGAIAVCASGTVTASAAHRKIETLHLYQVVQSTRFYEAAGNEIKINPPETLSAAGDWVDEIDND